LPPETKSSHLNTETRAMLTRYHSDFPHSPFEARGTLSERQPSSCFDNEEQLRLAY